MKTSAIVIIAFLICSMLILCESQIHTEVPCKYSGQCVQLCIILVNNKNAKCSNDTCTCYR
uniref:Potassium channel blocker pMeKTx16-1 n=1 Tax=Mesobuthus eupeus TaxID=34648 RepID=A0A088D9R3_MESEU|nr:potassium channel blocker pMeKTx16-1 [Mesobuthus eupeus]